MDQEFLIFVHVALEDFFDRAQQSLEGVALDRDHAAVSLGLYAGLADGVLDEGDLSEVVSLAVLEDLLGRSRALPFFGNKSSLSDDVESVSLVALLDDVGAGRELFLLEGIAELLLLIGVNFGKNLHLAQNLRVVLAFLGGGFLDDVVEGGPV